MDEKILAIINLIAEKFERKLNGTGSTSIEELQKIAYTLESLRSLTKRIERGDDH